MGMADLAQSHPELARRYHLLQQRCWDRGWEVWIVSSTRSEDTQRYWYALYLAHQWPSLVANPDRDAGATPWGWRAHGSLHMVQQDGFSHALDISWRGPWPWQIHEVANTCGLRFPEPTEDWHMQMYDAYSNGLYPVVEEVEQDMTPQQLGYIVNPEDPGRDVYGVMLLESWDIATNTAIYKWYSIADAETFTHQELKMRRLREEYLARGGN